MHFSRMCTACRLTVCLLVGGRGWVGASARTEWHTPAPPLPCPILRMRAVMNTILVPMKFIQSCGPCSHTLWTSHAAMYITIEITLFKLLASKMIAYQIVFIRSVTHLIAHSAVGTTDNTKHAMYRVPTPIGKMGRHFPVREFWTDRKSQGKITQYTWKIRTFRIND